MLTAIYCAPQQQQQQQFQQQQQQQQQQQHQPAAEFEFAAVGQQIHRQQTAPPAPGYHRVNGRGEYVETYNEHAGHSQPWLSPTALGVNNSAGGPEGGWDQGSWQGQSGHPGGPVQHAWGGNGGGGDYVHLREENAGTSSDRSGTGSVQGGWRGAGSYSQAGYGQSGTRPGGQHSFAGGDAHPGDFGTEDWREERADAASEFADPSLWGDGSEGPWVRPGPGLTRLTCSSVRGPLPSHGRNTACTNSRNVCAYALKRAW